MCERVRIRIEGTDTVLHEGPRSWSSPGRDPPPPEPTEYDRLPPYGEVLDFAGFPHGGIPMTLDEIIADLAALDMVDVKVALAGLRRTVW